jgi:hypothetical protein
MRRATTRHIGSAEDWRLDYLGYLSRRLPRFASVFRRRIHLHYLTVVCAIREAVVDGIHVRREGIRRKLKSAIRRSRAELRDEILGRYPRPLAEMPRENQLRVALKSDERVGVADLLGVRFV